MFRKIIGVTMAAAFMAMASSGLLMLLNESMAFQFRVHPVHKVFAVVLVAAGLCHLFLNRGALKAYLKERGPLLAFAALVLVMAAGYIAGFTRALDEDMGKALDEIARQVEGE
ncbi:MAG: hypothetical protein A2049_02980 [Elusimicrobia bacterium GWA2_62_23]|nr:MAG: hypothetical protein A2049_02980 [Elusimicrobia bacterium GWA2_62_23]